jgi:hypothetical protein
MANDNCVNAGYKFNPKAACQPCEYPSKVTSNPYPDCNEEPQDCAIEVCPPPIDEPCPEVMPTLVTDDVGCKWYPEVCLPSQPPAIPCAPVNSGFCRWDGGVPRWTNSCLDECDKRIADVLGELEYKQDDWSHVLDLSTHPEINTQLQVRTNKLQGDIKPMQFLALAAKLATLANMMDAVPEQVNENNMGIAYVKLDDGSYALSATHKGKAVGTPLPLVTTTDADGNVTGVSLPLPE